MIDHDKILARVMMVGDVSISQLTLTCPIHVACKHGLASNAHRAQLGSFRPSREMSIMSSVGYPFLGLKATCLFGQTALLELKATLPFCRIGPGDLKATSSFAINSGESSFWR